MKLHLESTHHAGLSLSRSPGLPTFRRIVHHSSFGIHHSGSPSRSHALPPRSLVTPHHVTPHHVTLHQSLGFHPSAFVLHESPVAPHAAVRSASNGLSLLKRLTPKMLNPMTRPCASTRSIRASCAVSFM